MTSVSVTDFRKDLQRYLTEVQNGETIKLTRRGEVIALVAPSIDVEAQAKKRLTVLRTKAKVGDVVSPIAEPWEADRASS